MGGRASDVQDWGYLLGVFIAISAGIAANIGMLMQKKAINELPKGETIGKKLLRNPIWVLGIFIGVILGAVLFFLANTPEWGVGAGLVPGLSAFGLIILAIGSLKILNERINRQDVLGILLMIGGITLLGFSELEIKIDTGSLELGFFLRATIFSTILVSIALFCHFFQRKNERHRGLFLAIFSGSMFAASNLWVAVVMALFGPVFGAGQYLGLFAITCVILIVTNVLGIFKLQQAFLHGDVSRLVPVQLVPIQVGPVFVYFVIFMLAPPKSYSLPVMIVGVILILVSSIFLARRQAQLEEIKVEDKIN